MDDVKRGEVAEGGRSKNTVAVVQRVDVHHTEVQQLRDTGQRSVRCDRSTLDQCVSVVWVWRYLCDLDVRFLGELRHQEVLSVRLGFDLRVQLQPGDRRLRTQIPVQRLKDDDHIRVNTNRDDTKPTQVYIHPHTFFTLDILYIDFVVRNFTFLEVFTSYYSGNKFFIFDLWNCILEWSFSSLMLWGILSNLSV